MHDAVAATEVVCYASRKLVANAMHCAQQTTDPTGMRLDRSLLVVCCCQCWKQSRETRVTRVEYSEQSVSLVSDLGWLGEVLPSLSAKLLVKSASTFLSAFRLLPRLEGVYIQRVFRPAATLRRIVVYQLAGWAGKWNAVPLTLNKIALGPLARSFRCQWALY